MKPSLTQVDLSLTHNWRRQLLLTHESSRDIDNPIEYVLLQEQHLPMKITKFCKDKWYTFGFDYDLSTKVLWPLDDGTTASELAQKINKKFKFAAIVVKKPPVEAHNLDINNGSEDSLRFNTESDEADC
jgi:hypothetical protein